MNFIKSIFILRTFLLLSFLRQRSQRHQRVQRETNVGKNAGNFRCLCRVCREISENGFRMPSTADGKVCASSSLSPPKTGQILIKGQEVFGPSCNENLITQFSEKFILLLTVGARSNFSKLPSDHRHF